MSSFEFFETEIPGLISVTPFCAKDIRGEFTKDYSREIFANAGLSYNLEEVFYTTSHPGVIRALHFQRIKQQPKLVRCVWGAVFDVVVDLRAESPSFKKWLSFDLTRENHQGLLIPAGCAHGYLVLKESVVSYKCAEKFYGEYDDGIIWDDADIGVVWPLDRIGGHEQIILAEKDRNLQTFAEFIETYEGF
jgi:dTDP-4-dehydrorhamnose 3,5-epimerase